MNILLTGAFGNIGMHTLRELLQRGHNVSCFDVKSPTTIKVAQQVESKVKIFWGDITKAETVKPALQGQDVVIHLAGIIPSLSEAKPDLCRKVNVDGTKLLLDLMSECNPKPRLLFTSSITVFGETLAIPPPRKVGDPLNPVSVYAKTKKDCEELIQKSSIQYVIFRLAAAMSINLSGMSLNKLDPMMFEINPDTRMEYLHPPDVGLAIANAIVSEEAWGHIYLIGGGKNCQFTYRDFNGGILDTVGIGRFPDEAYGKKPYDTDWLDTEESQRVLKYQRGNWEDYKRELKKIMGFKATLAKVFRPMIRKTILKNSPYWAEYQTKKASA